MGERGNVKGLRERLSAESPGSKARSLACGLRPQARESAAPQKPGGARYKGEPPTKN